MARFNLEIAAGVCDLCVRAVTGAPPAVEAVHARLAAVGTDGHPS